MAIPRRPLAGFLFYLIGATSALTFSESISPPVPKAISEMRDAIMKGLGFHGVEGLKVSGFDVRDSLVGQSVAYEFDIEVDKKVLPFKLLEDVNRWDFVDLPIFHPTAENDDEERALTERAKKEDTVSVPVLPPFQLAGPMELWIQDADDMRLALPHDVDAGTLRKVLLSDGAAVTVKGARSVSLRHPLDLPLPLNRTRNGPPAASGLLKIAKALRSSARSSTFGQQEQPLLSLRIVGPSSLTSSASASPNNRRLKLKRLSPGLVELSSPWMISEEEMELSQGRTLWPITSLNGSESNLRGFEELLASVLGNKALEQGSFKLLKAHVSAHTYLKMSFSVEKKLLPHSQEAGVDWSSFPSWKTKPEKATGHFEVLARLEQDGKVVPERILEVQPVHATDSVMDSVQIGNITMSKLPLMHPPPTYFAL